MEWENLLRREDMLPAVHETHTALVISVGDKVYKVKKPVSLGFADFSTFEERSRCSFSEVELNSRLAPDVYLGAYVLVAPNGSDTERVVVMRRLPESMKLERLIREGGNLSGAVRSVAHSIAGLHGSPMSIPKEGVNTSPSRYWDRWQDNLGQLLSLDISEEIRTRVLSIREKAKRYYLGRYALFEKRVSMGAIRDGHGDLRADSIYCLPDAPRIVDCLEFDDELRTMDRVEDIAFLAVDLERLGRPDLTRLLLETYREFSGDNWPASFMDASMAHWACVRAKVAIIADAQRPVHLLSEASVWLDLAEKHLEAASVFLVIVGGSPGTGKSTLADVIGMKFDWAVESSDLVRHDLLGVPFGESVGQSLAARGRDAYAPDEKMAVYEELLKRGRDMLRTGESVIMDATWASSTWRERARELAAEFNCGIVEIRCVAPKAEIQQRLIEREELSASNSDANWAVAEQIDKSFDPWDEASTVDTSGSDWLADLSLSKMHSMAAWVPV